VDFYTKSRFIFSLITKHLAHYYFQVTDVAVDKQNSHLEQIFVPSTKANKQPVGQVSQSECLVPLVEDVVSRSLPLLEACVSGIFPNTNF